MSVIPAEDLPQFARSDLHPLLSRLLEDPSALADVAAHSYVHDNGFVKIVLARGGPTGGAVRLHIWTDGQSGQNNIHNHCWPFTSLVLSGELEYEEYEPAESGEMPALHYAYLPSAGFNYDLQRIGPERLRRTRCGRHGAGDRYTMQCQTLHRTRARPGVPTVTVVSQGPRRLDRADVYVTAGVAPRIEPNIALPEDDLREHIRCVRDMLG